MTPELYNWTHIRTYFLVLFLLVHVYLAQVLLGLLPEPFGPLPFVLLFHPANSYLSLPSIIHTSVNINLTITTQICFYSPELFSTLQDFSLKIGG